MPDAARGALSGPQGFREVAVPDLTFIDRLPVKDAVEFYLQAAKEAIAGADIRELHPYVDIAALLYDTDAEFKQAREKFRRRYGPY